jgi:hypothetical protein
MCDLAPMNALQSYASHEPLNFWVATGLDRVEV